MTSIIASNGKNIKPNIIKQNNDIEFEKLEKYQNAIKIIKSSMFKVVNETKGTAYNSRSICTFCR